MKPAHSCPPPPQQVLIPPPLGVIWDPHNALPAPGLRAASMSSSFRGSPFADAVHLFLPGTCAGATQGDVGLCGTSFFPGTCVGRCRVTLDSVGHKDEQVACPRRAPSSAPVVAVFLSGHRRGGRGGGLGRYPDPLGAWIRPGRWGRGEGWGGEGRSLLRPVLLEHQPCLPCSPGSVPGMSSVCPVGGLRIRLLFPGPPASSPAASRTCTCTSPHRLVPHVAPFSSPPPRAAVKG